MNAVLYFNIITIIVHYHQYQTHKLQFKNYFSRLGQSARDTMNLIGSNQIQNLRFRDVWYFIGQKGIKGFSTMEEVFYSKVY